jgi:hypothetical protein
MYDSLRGRWCSKEVVGPFEVEVWKYIGEKFSLDLLDMRPHHLKFLHDVAPYTVRCHRIKYGP